MVEDNMADDRPSSEDKSAVVLSYGDHECKSLVKALLEAVMNARFRVYEPEKSLTSPGDEFYSRV